MKISVPRELKTHEYRVGLTPANVAALVAQGHECLVESGAGIAIGFGDDDYRHCGATLVADPRELYERGEMIVKVKEPQPEECELIRPEQLLFCYLHLAASRLLLDCLRESRAVCIAYETVTDERGQLPLLAPMSEVAGRMSVQAGAHHLENPRGGAGVLLGGVSGVAPASVVIVGGGVVGTQAARMAVGLGAEVTVVDKFVPRLRELDQMFAGRIKTLAASPQVVAEAVRGADLVIGAVLVSGAAAPKVVSREMIGTMRPGSVVVDVAIDQGGCFDTSRPTTHEEPTFLVDGVVHYCVANIPGAVARTSTQALTNASFPFVEAIANKGLAGALENPHLVQGLNLFQGRVTHPAVAASFGLDYTPVNSLI
ncbi:alanine dehydrogenase [Gilvimarinus sp. F26214L]|uniref:alanine dehydrogenase n=1 Tax=Gilvimarinus sp. DZF01 TaxID=3461371 RepID=UPI0040462C35